MVTLTANKSLSLLSSLVDTGTWGPLVNNNWSIADAGLGGTASVSLSSAGGALTLTASSYNNFFLQFTGSLPSDTIVTLPAIGSFYSVVNNVSNSSLFKLTLATTAAGSQAIGLPPGALQDILTDGSNVKFKSLPPIGSCHYLGATAVPSWVTACTVPPYLYCNGATFSSATYPYLNALLGSTTLPDFRGRVRSAYNDGTGRITSGAGGVDGNIVGAAGGSQTRTLSSVHMPLMPYTDPTHFHFENGNLGGGITGIAHFTGTLGAVGGVNTNSAGVGITIGNVSPTSFITMSPIVISGITVIRAG
jgi:microcystin-dependent protein